MASSAAFELILELKDHASKGLGQAAQQGGFLKNALSFATGGAILGGITAIGKAAGDMFGDAIEEAKEWNTGLGQLDAVLTSTGGKAGLTRDEILGLNKSLSAGGGFSAVADDAVLSGQNMLLTFTNIGEGVMPDATKAMLDMATAMNNGVTPSADQLNSTSIQLGKALNDPIKGISALSRVGVTFTQQQKDQIKAMVEAGDTMGAQKLILAELNGEFGGSATAAMSSFAGQQALMGEQFNNMKQTIGEALMPVLSGLTSFVSTTLMPAFEAGAAIFGDLVNYFRLVVTDGDALNDFLTHLPEPLQPIIQFFGEIVTHIRDFIAAIQSGESPLQALSNMLFNIAESVEGPLGPILGFFSSIVENVERFIQAIQAGESPIDAFFKLIGDNVSAIGGLWDRLGPMLGELAGNILKWVGEQVPPLLAKLAEWGQALITWVSDSLPGWISAAGEFIGSVLQWIGEQLPPLLGKLAEWGGAFVGWIMESYPGWLAKAGEFIGAALKWIVEMIPVIVAKLAEWAGAFIGWIVPQIPGLLLKLGEFLLAIGTWVLTVALPAIVKQLIEWGGAFLGWIGKDVLPFLGAKLGEIWTALTTWLGEQVQKIKDKIAEWATAFWTWITSVKDGIGTKLAEIWNKLTAWVTKTAKDIVEKVKSIGEAILEGIKAGITGAWEAFTGWIGGIATGIVDGFKKALGIASPSRLIADEIGKPMAMGLRVGFEEEMAITNPALQAGGAAMPAFIASGWSGGFPNLRATMIGDIDLLVGEVASRAAQIQQMMHNLQMSGSASSSGTGFGMWDVNPSGGGGGGGIQVMDRGGIVTGPRLAALAMDGRPEAVIPLDRMGRGGLGGGTNIYVTVNAPLLANSRQQAGQAIAEVLYDILEGRR